MKTIGLIGGMSWESTQLYYQIINKEVARRLGGLHSARLNVVSLNFADIAAHQRTGDWGVLAQMLADAARRLEDSGAQCLLIGTNTMHRVAPEVEAAISVPLLHIADTTAHAIRQAGMSTVGLLGTRFTMEQPFYRERLARHDIDCVVPSPEDRNEVHRIIFEELCQGTFNDTSRQHLQRSIADLTAQGAQAVVLGCTELPLILSASHASVPLFDTTTLHALAAVDFALAREEAMPPSLSSASLTSLTKNHS